MNKKKVLIISTVGLIYDGITSVIISYLEAMNISDLDIQLVGTVKVEESIRKKVEKMGFKIIDLPNRKEDTFKYFNTLRQYIHNEKIEVVHAHGNSGTLAIELLAAKLGGARKRIAHSHNTKCNQVKADKMLRPLFNCLYTDALACGDEAGKWLFGNKPYIVLKNGRNITKYMFKYDMREKMREKYGLKDELIIGHVGGFYDQKNHAFLIDVFREILNKDINAKLFLIGDGPLRNTIENSVSDIKSNVIFNGNTDCVEDYLSMMDVMVLPSFFEGLPLVVIEWQINGLPCVLSDTITEECKVCENVFFLSIHDSAKKWADLINSIKCMNRERNADICYRTMIESDFNIEFSADQLRNIYTRAK